MILVPRVTIGIPTFNRPDRLLIAVGSALAQSMPVRVLVADQTGTAEAAMRPYFSHPFVQYFRSDATCSWENWTAVAGNCQTEFFCWLQDDDIVAGHLAHRICAAFDSFPDASVWLARLGLAGEDGIANWWQSTGPMVPMNLLQGLPCSVPGLLIAAGAYFNSFALSPGMAFRWSLEAMAAIRRCPKDCDIYNERLVIAELTARPGARAVCDPALVGSWVQHEGNDSKRLIREGARTSQYPAFAKRLDELLEGREGWESMLEGWARMLGPGVLEHWLEDNANIETDSHGLRRSREIFRKVLGETVNLDPDRSVKPEVTLSRKARRAERAVSRR